MRSVSKWQICIGVMLALLLQMEPSFALDPRFELDLKALRAKQGQNGAAAEKKDVVVVPMPRKLDKGALSGGTGKSVKMKNTRRSVQASRNLSLAASGKRSLGRVNPGASFTGRSSRAASAKVAAYHTLSMQASAGEPLKGVRWARQVWDRLLASRVDEGLPLQVEGRNFSLSLDPSKYPVLPAADGGKIILDAGRSLSPLVKAIITEKDPSIRIVSENPADRRRFFSSLFAAARFYSVEEGFSVSFGADPKVTVMSDFKVERSPESLSDSEVFLVNVNDKRFGIPDSLLAFMEAEGFHMVDSTPPPTARFPDGRRILCSIRGGSRESVSDALLKALSIDFERDRDLELDGGAVSGVNLTVRADIYHEARGNRVVVSFAEANPVQHTLLKLLELKGYKVVMLYPDDDFRKISQKLLSVFKVPATYGTHHLWSPREAPYDVQLSGFVLGGGVKDDTIVLTNVALDPMFRELVGVNGYEVVEK